MTGCYSWCCHIERYSVSLPVLKLDVVTQQIMHRMGLILYSARLILWVCRSAPFINIHLCVCSMMHRQHPKLLFLPIYGQSPVGSARVCEVRLKISQQNNELYPPLLLRSFSQQTHSRVAINHCLVQLIKDYYISNCGGNK